MSKKNILNLSVSIVSFNTKVALQNCLYSIYKTGKNIQLEVFVVDNASKDGSGKMVKKKFPKVNLIKNKKNIFFTKAHNQALKKAKGKYVLILNSDTIINQNTLAKAVNFLNTNPQVGALGVLHKTSSGSIERTCQRLTTPIEEFFHSNILAKFFKSEKLMNKVHYKNWNRKTSRYVEAVSDACLFAPRKVLEKIGFYDERFLLFFTENDLCARIAKAGFKIYHLAPISITHLRGQSLAHFTGSKNSTIYEHDMLEYYKKYFGIFWWLILWLAYRPNWLYWKFKQTKNNLKNEGR